MPASIMKALPHWWMASALQAPSDLDMPSGLEAGGMAFWPAQLGSGMDLQQAAWAGAMDADRLGKDNGMESAAQLSH